MRHRGDAASGTRRYALPSSGRRSAPGSQVVFKSHRPKAREVVVGTEFNLIESVVREYLRDHSGMVYCSRCLIGALAGTGPGGVISAVMIDLAERQPPFSAGRCGCGSEGLSYSLP